MNKQRLVVLIVCGLFGPKLFASPDSLNMALVGNWPFGAAYAIALDSTRNIAFLGSGGGVYILDISNLQNPVKISEKIRTTGVVHGITYQDNRLYIAADQGGMEIWDVADPVNPFRLGQFPTAGYYCHQVSVDGHYAYLAAYGAGLRIVDVEDPTSPKEIGFCDSLGSTRCVAISDSYAFVAAGEFLFAVNISDPSHPYKVDSCVSTGAAEYVVVSDTFAYVANFGDIPYPGGLQIVDIADPMHLKVIGFCGTSGNPPFVTVTGHDAYVVNWNGSNGITFFSIIDISEPSAPIRVGRWDSYYMLNQVAVSGHYCYDAVWGGLRVIDVSDSSNPFWVSSFYNPGAAWAVTYLDNYLYILDGSGKLRTIDIHDPSYPVESNFLSLDTTSIEGGAADLDANGQYVYACGGGMGFFTIDPRNPSSPSQLGKVWASGSRLTVSGSYAYCTGGVFTIIVCQDIYHPKIIGAWANLGGNGEAIIGSDVYVACDNGLRVVDVSNPYYPKQIAFDSTSRKLFDVVISTYAYVASDSGLRVFDIHDPNHPVEISSCGNYSCKRISIQYPYVYLLTDKAGLRMIDITDPKKPADVGHYNNYFLNEDIATHGPYIYVTGYNVGLVIYKNLLLEPRVNEDSKLSKSDRMFLSVKPARTGFRVEYNLANYLEVSLSVFDCSGRVVKQENLGRKNSGTHSFFLNMTGIANGVYFIRLSDGAHKATAKTVWVR